MVKQAQRELDLRALEERVQEFWETRKIYEKSKARLEKKPKYYFLDGPPYASGAIHLGTAWNKILKDSVVRYLAAKGLDVRRQAGWDCHGLPIEVKVEEKLGIKNKKEIEELGIDRFVGECKKWATEHIKLMGEQFRRLGVWMDWDSPYTTMRNEYMEAAWWTLKKANKKGLLTKDLRVVTWCPRCETALADAEIEYQDRSDPSIYVKFPLVDRENEYILIWTTTPWTLIANLAVMVHPDYEYVRAKTKEGVFILAKELAPVLKEKLGMEYEVLSVHRGSDLEGLRYSNPLSTLVSPPDNSYVVILTPEYVTLEEGTGCVHSAPGHGPEDFEVGSQYGIPPICPVDERGVFTEEAGRYAGKIVKKDDKVIIKDLKEKGALVASESMVHRYGHCWRCKTPIIYRATEQWFIQVSKLREKMLKEIDKVEWVPEWAGSARFKDWVSNAKDWTISRQRYWGIPLPIWVCGKCGGLEVVGSRGELEAKANLTVTDLHKPEVDKVTLQCNCGGTMRRVPDVLDVWFDSGVAAWASLNYPSKEEEFEKWYPADFITEGHDQTRGWFYSMLGCGLLALDEVPYRRVLMHGFTLDEKGEKMSKSLGNVVHPEEVVNKYGVEVLRFYVLWSNKPWEDLRFNWEEVGVVQKMFNVLWNVHVFATTYMSIDGFSKEKIGDKMAYRLEDRWMLSKLNTLVKEVTRAFDDLHLYRTTRALKEFVLEDLSRWYVTLARPRIWVEKDDPEKLATYATLYEVLTKLSLIMAPIAPHLSEEIYHNFDGSEESVHLEPWPTVKDKLMDPELEADMTIVRSFSNAVAAARGKKGVKRRWPVARIVYKPTDEGSKKAIERLMKLVGMQCNVLEMVMLDVGEDFGELKLQPNFKHLGPDFKELADDVARYIQELEPSGAVGLPEGMEVEIKGKKVKLTDRHAVLKRVLPEDFISEEFEFGEVFLDLHRTQEVRSLGFAREVVRRIQEMRKEMDLDIEAFIEASVAVDDEEVVGLLRSRGRYISEETRARVLKISTVGEDKREGYTKTWPIEESKFIITIARME
ncbi:MAG: isoleucine--tRNA ligase [Candidatus Hydrothermarchaeaceae archaeon]